MENHPIPQDITGFQFKLIGNMTVRQFIYLATGTVIAWLFFFILPLPGLIRWPIALVSIGFGAALAFLPIDGRPMDVMFMNLMKAIFAPTQYIYDKTGGTIIPSPIPTSQDGSAGKSQNQTQPSQPQIAQPQTLSSAQAQPQPSPVQAQSTPVAQQSVPPPQQIQTVQPPAPIQPPVPAPNLSIPQPTPIDVSSAQQPGNVVSLGWEVEGEDKKNKTEDVGVSNKLIENERKLEGEVAELKKELEEAKAEEKLSLGSNESSELHQKAADLEKMLEQTISQKAELEKELTLLKTKLQGAASTQTFTPSTATPPQTQHVRVVPKGLEKTIGVIQTQAPNLITGIIKDPRGNPLQGVLVEVKDLDDNPVRAFKTNALGQFASATSLSNGKYLITFEDTKGQNRFDTVQIEATGADLMPLEIFSIDPREELRRELFN